MSFANAEEARKHRNIYFRIFGALAVLTLITVAVAEFGSKYNWPMPFAIAVALFVASVKGALVACYFMHLLTEKKVLYLILLICVAFFAVLILVPVFTDFEPPWRNLMLQSSGHAH